MTKRKHHRISQRHLAAWLSAAADVFAPVPPLSRAERRRRQDQTDREAVWQLVAKAAAALAPPPAPKAPRRRRA